MPTYVSVYYIIGFSCHREPGEWVLGAEYVCLLEEKPEHE